MVKAAFILASLAAVIRVSAQDTDVKSCVEEYKWTINSRGQTPCLVAAYLESSCGVVHSVNKTPPGTHYIGPKSDEADRCSCNSVTYSLIEACGLCQGQTRRINFTEWVQNCSQVVDPGQFPTTIPPQVELPSWATLDVTQTGNIFDPTLAQQEAFNHDFPSASGSTTPIATPSISPASELPHPTSASAPAESAGAAPSSSLSPGGIAGITIAALVVIVAVLVFIFWKMLKARKRKERSLAAPFDETSSPFDDKQGPTSVSNLPGHAHTRSLSDPASAVTPFTYTQPQPSSPGASTVYTSAPARSSIENIPHTPMGARAIMSIQRSDSPAFNRGYTGAPEV